MQLENIKCRNCGAEIDIESAVNGVVQCEYCRSKFTLPKEDITPAALKFLHDGESSLYICRFDDAYSFYKKAAELSPKEPEAYWGMAISQFKVQYVKDEVNDRLQPICHHISTDKISDNSNYKKAVSLATAEQRAEYERQAEEIDYIREEFYKLKQTGKEYDCFICVKVTDDTTKQRTADYKHADDIYFDLKGKGYNPFFSERELGEVTGADYEARILYALYTSECMIVVCGKEEYLHTKWVKNEYTRFLRLVGDEQKESDSITIAFYGRPVEYLPGKNGKIQGIDLRSLNASEKITKFVEDHTPEARERRKQAEQAKKESEAAILKEIEKQLEERLKNLQKTTTPVQTNASITTDSLLERANQFLAGGEYNNATNYFNKVLDIDPKRAEAWFGLLLSASKVKNYQELFNGRSSSQIAQILGSKQFKMAKLYAGGNIGRCTTCGASLDAGKAKNGVIQCEFCGTKYPLVKFSRMIQEAEEFAHKKALSADSADAWKRFLSDVSLQNNLNSIGNLDRGKVEKIIGNKNLTRAYAIADEEQKAYYNIYMARIKKCVVELKSRAQAQLPTLKNDLNIKTERFNAHNAKYGKLSLKSSMSLRKKYNISFAIISIILVGLFFYLGNFWEFSDGWFAPFLLMVLGSVALGAALGLIPLLVVFLPIRICVNKNNKKAFTLERLREEMEESESKLKEVHDEISLYEKCLEKV